MATDSENVPRTFEQLSRQQLEIYAKELREHFQQEQRLSQQLKEQNLQLERRLRQISALNRMLEAQTYFRAYHLLITFVAVAITVAIAIVFRIQGSKDAVTLSWYLLVLFLVVIGVSSLVLVWRRFVQHTLRSSREE